MDFDNLAQVQEAARQQATLPPVPMLPPQRSAWRTLDATLRAVPAAVAELAADVGEIGTAFVRSQREMSAAAFDPEKRRAQARGGVEGDGKNEVSRSLRNVADSYRPDPVTATKAEQVVFDVSRVLGKAAGLSLTTGPAAIPLLATSEGLAATDKLQQEGVDDATATKAGVVTGLMTGVGAVVPVAPLAKGFTAGNVGKVAGLAAVSGPTTFMAQQQMIGDVLKAANYSEIAKQYDPLDPLGLALSSLMPFGFGMLHLRGGKPAPKGKPAGPEPVSVEPTAPHGEVPQDVVDAAMVHNLSLQRDAHEAVPTEQAVRELQAMDEAQPASITYDGARRLRAVRDADGLWDAVDPKARDFGPLTEPLSQARELLATLGSKVNEHLAENPVHPAVNNLLIGLQETAANPKRADAFLGELAKRANEPGTSPANAAADAVEHVRGLTDEQINGTAEPAKAGADPLMQSIADRMAQIEAQMGDMVVRHDEAGNRITVADEMARVRKEAAEGNAETLGALDADLVNVAAACALTVGA